MRWQSAILVLGLIALSLVDLSSITSASSGPALDVAISLAASQVGLAAVWLALGRTSLVVRLAGTGLVVNTWATALPDVATSLVALLLSEVASVVVVLGGLRLAGFTLMGSAMREPRRPRQWTLGEMLAITTIVALAVGPARSLAADSGSSTLALMGMVFAAQTVGLVWAILGPLSAVESVLTTLLATSGSALAVMMIVDASGRLALVSLSSAVVTIAMLAVARVCGYRVAFDPVPDAENDKCEMRNAK